MRTQDIVMLEDWSFEEATNSAPPSKLRGYVDDDDAVEGFGLRALFEHPEALSRSFLRQMHQH